MLRRKLNHRNIELAHTTRAETVGVRRRDGSTAYLPWRGFIEAAAARKLPAARPILLVIDAVGHFGEISPEWRSLKAGEEFVQGCLVGGGVFAVLEHGDARVVTRQVPPPTQT